MSQEVNYISTDIGIFKFDLSNCSTQFISGFGDLTDIAIMPSGNLYGIDFYNFYHIDPNSANITLISSIDTFGGGFNSLIGIDDEWLLAIRANSELYKINAITGDTNLIGSLGYYPAGDLTFYKGHFYMVDISNQLVKFDFNTVTNQISSVTVVDTMNTPFSAIYGVVTIGNANCYTDSLRLVAFEGTNAFLVDPTNGNCTSICSPLIIASITGATSMSEVSNQMFELEASLPNIFTPNSDGTNDFFEPLETIKGASEGTVCILNRWGNVVFSEDIDVTFQWDGMSNNDKCDDGVYFYKITLKGYCENESVLTGFVHLAR